MGGSAYKWQRPWKGRRLTRTKRRPLPIPGPQKLEQPRLELSRNTLELQHPPVRGRDRRPVLPARDRASAVSHSCSASVKNPCAPPNRSQTLVRPAHHPAIEHETSGAYPARDLRKVGDELLIVPPVEVSNVLVRDVHADGLGACEGPRQFAIS